MVYAASLLLAAAVSGFCQQNQPAPFTKEEIEAARKDPKAFTPADDGRIQFGGVIVHPLEVTPPPPGGDDPSVVLDTIVNIGRKLWTIIDENKPVVDVRTQYATAVPEGITHWTQLAGWDPPLGNTYGFLAKNAYGGKVVEVRYQVLRTAGGSYKGKGSYLTGVTVEPLLVNVAWGYKFTMAVDVPSVTNADKTGQNPLAGMMVNVKWRIQTPIKDSQGTAVYYVRGDGLFLEVGGPFTRKEVAQAGERVKSMLQSRVILDGRGGAW